MSSFIVDNRVLSRKTPLHQPRVIRNPHGPFSRTASG
jgi:hypothetical protein